MIGRHPAPTVLCVSAAQDLGGGEFVLLDTIEVLRARGMTVRALNLAPVPGAFARVLASRGIATQFCRIGRFRSVASAARVLYHFARAASFDVAVANDTRAFLYTALGCAWRRRPCVWHVHDLITGSGPFQKVASRLRPDAYVAVSNAVRLSLEASGCPAERVTVVPNAVDLDSFHPGVDGSALRDEVGVGPGGVLVGAVSRILPWKGLDTFVEAAGLLRERLPDTQYVIVGDVVTDRASEGEAKRYRDELLGLRDRLGLRERFHFVGWREDVRGALAALDVLVHTAIEDPFPRVLIEAMASGKPIVATRGGGVPEMIEHEVTGYVIAPRNAAELATRLEVLSDPATRSRLGQAGRHRAERLFGLARYGAQMYAVVGGLAGRGR